MMIFTMGAAVAYLILFGVGMVMGWTWLRDTPRAVSEYAVLLVLLPTIGAYVATEGVNLLRKARAFDLRVRASPGAAALGFVSGVVGAVMIAGALLLPYGIPDYLLCGASGFASAFLVALCLRRARAGRCIHCDYDLAGASGARCPECGNGSDAMVRPLS